MFDQLLAQSLPLVPPPGAMVLGKKVGRNANVVVEAE
jgi:hypothetical protein